MADLGFAPHRFRVHAERRDGSSYLFASGEVDLGTAWYLEEALDALQQEREAVVVDLGDVTFMGACGIDVFTDAAARAKQRGGRLAIVNCPRAALRVFEVAASLRLVDGPVGTAFAESLDAGLPSIEMTHLEDAAV